MEDFLSTIGELFFSDGIEVMGFSSGLEERAALSVNCCLKGLSMKELFLNELVRDALLLLFKDEFLLESIFDLEDNEDECLVGFFFPSFSCANLSLLMDAMVDPSAYILDVGLSNVFIVS